MTRRQAEREAQAKAWVDELDRDYTNPDGTWVNYDAVVARAVEFAAATERAVWEDLALEGKLWSFFRTLLSQGGDIQQDYNAGKYKGYEEYSARLDAAARERVKQWLSQRAKEVE